MVANMDEEKSIEDIVKENENNWGGLMGLIAVAAIFGGFPSGFNGSGQYHYYPYIKHDDEKEINKNDN